MKSTQTKVIIRSIFLAFSLSAILPIKAQVTFDGDKPTTTYNHSYSQTFSTWDGTKLYDQWDAVDSKVFTAADIASGYLKYEWITKRILCSKSAYATPYILQTDIDYANGSNRGGVIIRVNSSSLDDVQEPPAGDPGFNREGIAFYPTEDGSGMIVQFSAAIANPTPVTRITVPKPAGVTSLKNEGKLKIEDFGSSIYVYYNDAPFIRIDLKDLTAGIYTSGTVYSSDMTVQGTFSGMEVAATGKVAIAQRDATLRLYGVSIQSHELVNQTISFGQVGNKHISDSPFTISATSTSGLPVELKYVSGPATLSGNTVTLTGNPGVVTIAADQGGNASYYPATEAQLTFYVSDPELANMTVASQDYTDNWVATDALDRTLPLYSEAGKKRENKTVGVFYYIWHGYHDHKVYDQTKILANYPSDPLSPSNTAWGPVSAFHFWSEPEEGYFRAEDPWVIRRNMQMLSNAHVDFIFFDVTNAFTYLETVKAVCEVCLQMRKEGTYTPQIAFTTAASSGKVMNDLYDQFYSKSFYKDLWFYWNGKPLILGNFNDPELRSDVMDFFTIKYSWAWTDQSKANYWQWVDTYPQDYGWSTDPSIPEQIPVSAAQHPTSTTGTSYHDGAEPAVNSNYLTSFTGQGLHFAEQWSRALKVDPSLIMVTQWNEWIAQRFIWDSGSGIYAGRPIVNGDTYFVDDFTEEFTRDMAPMKGGHTDNYYYQLISNIRKYKGMSAPQVFSAPATINIDGNFSEWNTVTPIFRDSPGDVMHRNFAGYDPDVTYTNNTGRNDIVESRSTYDANNLYFYVKTAQNISPYTDPNWMLLFIDADRNKNTGWEGFDFVVNLNVKSDTETTLRQWNGKSWGNETSVPYRMNGTEMELSIPRTTLSMNNANPEFYFKWIDNPQQLNDISCCFTDGDAAPDRRFNFNFSTSEIKTVTQTAYKEQRIPGTVEFEDFDNGGNGVAYADKTMGNAGGAYRTDEAVDIESITGGGYGVTDIDSSEWLEYTVDVDKKGIIPASIHYAAATDGNKATIYVDGLDRSGVLSFPASGGAQTLASLDVNLSLTTGKHVLKFYIEKATGDFMLDNIVFAGKGNDSGANFSFYPNPVTDNRLNINSGKNKVSSLEVLDLQGRVVYTSDNQFTGQKTIDITLAKGCYFLKLKGDVTFSTQKLVIQ